MEITLIKPQLCVAREQYVDGVTNDRSGYESKRNWCRLRTIPSGPVQYTDTARSQAGFAGESCTLPGTGLDSQRLRRHTALARRQHSADSNCIETPCLAERLRASKSSWSRKPRRPVVLGTYQLFRRESRSEAFGLGPRPAHYREPQPEHLPTSERVSRPFWLSKSPRFPANHLQEP